MNCLRNYRSIMLLGSPCTNNHHSDLLESGHVYIFVRGIGFAPLFTIFFDCILELFRHCILVNKFIAKI
jgi:hypothetical protein